MKALFAFVKCLHEYLTHIPAFVWFPDVFQSQLGITKKIVLYINDFLVNINYKYLPNSFLCKTNSNTMILSDNIILNC